MPTIVGMQVFGAVITSSPAPTPAARERDRDRVGAGSDADREPHLAVVGERFLERFEFSGQDVAAGLEHTTDCRVQLGPQTLGLARQVEEGDAQESSQ